MRATIVVAMLWAFAAHAEDMPAPAPAKCPDQLGAGAECWSGKDRNGAYYWIAKPKAWNQVLIVHAHGGPRLPTPQADSPIEDLVRFAVMVKAGYAWIGTAYRRGGYGVAMAVEDMDNSRLIFVDKIAKPRRIIAHGQSWGGNVAAKLDETPSLARFYDGVLLTSGVLGGGTHGYDYRIDLRAVYNFYCRNHPRPDEPQYPLNIGLPANSTLSNADLQARIDECTGVQQPAAARSEAQKRNLANILAVTRIPERTLVSHMNWATFLFRDIVAKRLDGRAPFGNIGVQYRGASDDAALNAGVARLAADPQAVAKLAEDSDLSGRIALPTITLHAIDDPTAFVEHEARYRDSVAAAGKSDLLVQNFLDEHDHSYLTAPAYVAALEALLNWIDKGAKPTPAEIAAACQRHVKEFGERCNFVTDYKLQPYASRVYPR